MSIRALFIALLAGIAFLSSCLAQTAQEQARSDFAPYGSMMGTQFRHMKLWFAGKLGNWKLAAYELDQIERDLAAAALSSGAPAQESLVKRTEELRETVNARDWTRFADAYGALTNECNGCHRATGHAFITVQIPTSSPFSDQAFEDQVAEGRSLARRICGECHGLPDRSTATAARRFGAPGLEDVVRRPSFSEDSVRGLLTSNHRRLGPDQTMPNPRLTNYEIDEIVAYFRELRSGANR
jgi:cytochrome c553